MPPRINDTRARVVARRARSTLPILLCVRAQHARIIRCSTLWCFCFAYIIKGVAPSRLMIDDDIDEPTNVRRRVFAMLRAVDELCAPRYARHDTDDAPRARARATRSARRRRRCSAARRYASRRCRARARWSACRTPRACRTRHAHALPPRQMMIINGAARAPPAKMPARAASRAARRATTSCAPPPPFFAANSRR